MRKGFTLVEVIVGTAIFLIVALAAYSAYSSVFQLANNNQSRILAVGLADEQFEILRNMPYSNIGEVNGIPVGTIPRIQTLARGGIPFTVTTVIRNVDLPFDGIMGSTTNNDLKPADNKLAQITVSCDSCKGFQPISVTGYIAPKNVEANSTNGSLKVQVFDANGDPVQGASVHVVDTATTTLIVVDDTTANNGILQVIDVPPGVTAYSVVATKSGYSSDQTYAPSGGNPNPLKPYVTVAVQQLSQVSFFIDRLSSLSFNSVSPTCQSVGNFHFNMVGGKQIGVNVPKYSQSLVTNSSGILNLNSMEWDSYSMASNDPSYYLAGINPLNPVSLSPNSTQNIQLVVVPRSVNALLVTVKDSSTHLPISNATVNLTSLSGYNKIQMTGQGYLNQVDWSLGSGQDSFINPSKYWNDDGNVDTATSSGNILLKKVSGSYKSSGWLESSTFDTGTSSNFYGLSWLPGSQPIPAGASSTLFQFATSASSTPVTWNYLGPDGTSESYYNSPNSTISTVHNGNEYARYKLYLSTQSSSVTPSISNIAFTFTSGCTPPGQVIFSGLSAGNYELNISKDGYTAYSGSVLVGSGWKEQQVLLGP
ncbi:MAG: prepilin-type N-terminal cleavage/methylation domain-containing protein [Candidatus Taylorbacteria bacterium]|nr:prepilin-type N-terminal cleavage/methylation domain-containing protein [Candidatus Taylorbacteria bacterium]